mgnify:CR=1 FL=1
MFIGRHKELNKLTEKVNKDRFECMLLYGRRWIGKTELINEAQKVLMEPLFITNVNIGY